MNDKIQIIEDSKGKAWSSKAVFYAVLRAEKPLLPLLIPLFIISLISKIFFHLPPILSPVSDMLIFLLFIGPVGGTLSMVIFRILPNRWSITEQGVSIRGRGFETIKWERVLNWSLTPIEDLSGYHVLRIHYKFARKVDEACIVINPSNSIEKIRERIATWSSGLSSSDKTTTNPK